MINFGSVFTKEAGKVALKAAGTIAVWEIARAGLRKAKDILDGDESDLDDEDEDEVEEEEEEEEGATGTTGRKR
jgi:hypothetical protein